MRSCKWPLLFIIFIINFLFFCFPSYSKVIDIKKSVVKIYTIYNPYNFHEPWQKKGQMARQGSGCIIDRGRILTNAHVVSDAVFIEVRKFGDSKRYTAKVVAVAHDSDLAILTVDDESFFEDVYYVPIGDLPEIEDEVTVYGFPAGGDRLSITKGVVSRIEHVNYAHSGAFLLACQIDAPINEGNSGGPVILNGKLVGVAFQGLPSNQYENIGYMVPAPVIKRFLKDMEDGKYDGVPALGVPMQKLENPDIQKFYGISDAKIGVLVNRVTYGSPAEGILKPGDVVLECEGYKIANDGTIEFRPNERTFWGYIFQQKQIGDKLNLTILRNGKKKKVTIVLSKPVGFERLVPNEIYDTSPSYYILGGLVFEKLTLNYLKEYGMGTTWIYNAPVDLTNFYVNGFKTKERQEIVVLVKVLADNTTKGYLPLLDAVIDKVNGKKISTIKDLVKFIKENTGPYHIIEDIYGHKIVLEVERLKKDTTRILRKYKILEASSPDLKNVN